MHVITNNHLLLYISGLWIPKSIKQENLIQVNRVVPFTVCCVTCMMIQCKIHLHLTCLSAIVKGSPDDLFFSISEGFV